MTKVLESMARAICYEYHLGCGFDADSAAQEVSEMWPEWVGEARAALIALRDGVDESTPVTAQIVRAYVDSVLDAD